MATLAELRHERLRKLEALKSLGINPYPADSKRSHTAKAVVEQFEQLEGQTVHVTGRILATRKFGKIAFFVLKDASGKLQLFLKDDQLAPLDIANSGIGYDQLNLLDPGDFIEAEGQVVKTQTGEISIAVTKLRLLSKSLRPLPTEQEGFTNKEERLRRRYVDTNVNSDVYQRFIRRSRFWQATRDFLNARGFHEINLPVLEHVTGGADANPFVTHMDALDQDFYLRISHELYIKRLIGGGYERIYDIGVRFRNENYSDEHLPEHVAMEFNAAYMDYHEGMDLAEDLMKFVAKEAFETLQFKVGQFDINLDQPWPKIAYADIMRDKMGVDVFNPDLNQLKQILRDHKAFVTDDMNVNRALDGVWKLIRAQEAGPFWLIHEPIAISPLSKALPEDPRLSARVHPVIAGTEAGNGYSELNDPIDQLNRFKEQQSLRDAGDNEAQMLDIDFVEMMEYGMPPNFGWGHSERFFWMLEGVSAREGVPFPQLRHEIDEVTKSIYPELYN
jgi:lysyl-tRNA synthetase class 2